MTVTNSYRRPSQARIRKSISKRTREVTWCPTEETVHEIDTYDSIDHADIWWSRDELLAIRRSNEFFVAGVSDGEESEDSEHETMRGLESWTDQGGWERYQHHRDCMNRVLDEQDRQRGIDQTEFQHAPYPIVKRINHMHIPFDHNRLGALCRDATARARRVALLRGKQDSSEPKEQKTKPMTVKELRKKFELANSDNDTVQTAASSTEDHHDCDGTFLSTSTGMSSAEQTPPLPAVVSCLVTPEMLQDKHNARFAAYLANRQQRIDAQLKADFEWEQRRLARRALLCKETDLHLEKMHSLIRATNQLIVLVSAGRAA